jgi:DNA-directed RNA polymerase specialized sigma24 family protein
VLHHLVDLPVEEVAATLDARTGTVKSWLARGRRALAAMLSDPEEVLHQ